MKRMWLYSALFWAGHVVLVMLFVTCVRFTRTFDYQPTANPLDVSTIINRTGMPLQALITVDGPPGSPRFTMKFDIGTTPNESHRLWPRDTPQPRFRIGPSVYRLEIVGIIAPPSSFTNVITINGPSGTYYVQKIDERTIGVSVDNMTGVTGT